MKIEFSHFTLRRWQSWGCTLIILYASLMSAFTRNAPLPTLSTSTARWYTEEYDNDARDVEMPSLTLPPSGDERSTIKRHFLG